MTSKTARYAIALLVAVLSSAATGAPAAAQPLPGTTCSLFPADSIFNADISALPVHSQSVTWKGNMTQNSNLHPDLGTFAQWYGEPVNVAPPPSSGLTPTFLYNSQSDHPAEGYPIDQATFIEGGPGAPSGSDRHALVVNKNLCKLYEIYNLQNFTNGQQPQAGSGAVWDLSSEAMRPDTWTSADAAGLPMTPLLLRSDEILAGSITHAIRFTAHCTSNSYIWPASHNAGSCNSSFPPMGARFRLRAGFNISGFSPNTQVVLRAFQHYGMLLADNGADWFFAGTTDDWWGTTAGNTVVSELKTIPAAQFDAVDESGLQAVIGSYRAVGGRAAVNGKPLLADYDGDGNADEAMVGAGGASVGLSNGSAFTAPQLWSSLPFYGTVTTLAGDVTGDGKADLVAVNAGHTFVMVSTGTGFAAPACWATVAFYGTRGTFLADVNGDGKADLVAVNAGSTWVMLSSGADFSAPTLWSGTPFYGNVATLVGDVSGDGKADLIAVNAGATFVMTSTGAGFAAPTLWSNKPFYGTLATMVADVSGDRKADLVALNNGSTFVMTSTGSAFGAPALWSGTPFYGQQTTVPGDASGDGKADLVAINNTSVWAQPSTGSGFSSPALWLSGAP